jgi:hypothetical protein
MRQKILNRLNKPLPLRFWEKVNISPNPQKCWEWKAGINTYGYGQFCYQSRPHVATRIAWLIAHGAMPDGLVLHSCDNPLCVNPAHLRIGNHKDNAEDALERGQHAATKQETCKRGHSLNDPANLFRLRSKPRWRICKACSVIRRQGK